MIEDYFEKILKFKEETVEYNKKIIQAIEIFNFATKLENRKVFKEHFKKLDVNDSGGIELEDCSQIKNCIEEVQEILKTVFVTKSQFTKKVNFDQIPLKSMKEEQYVLTNDLVVDYEKMQKFIHDSLQRDCHSTKMIKRNFKI